MRKEIAACVTDLENLVDQYQSLFSSCEMLKWLIGLNCKDKRSESIGLCEEGYSFHYLETDEYIKQNLELMQTTFSKDEGVDEIVRRLIEHNLYIPLKDHFTIKHSGKMVASLNLIPQTWSVEGIPLKAAEMGCVATHPEHRKKGIRKRLAEMYHHKATFTPHKYPEGIEYVIMNGNTVIEKGEHTREMSGKVLRRLD